MMLSSPAPMAHASAMWLAAAPRLSTEKSGEIAQRWMEMVLGEKFAQGFPKVLLSGEWLCALANKVFVALGMRERSCASIKTSWPEALSVSSTDSMLVHAGGESLGSEWSVRDSSGDAWMQQKKFARQNVEEYLRACEVIGVVPQDCFEPDDLLELHNLDKVYRNILALQSVAVSISHRRSIDERSSLGTSYKPSVSSSSMPSLIASTDSMMSPRSSADFRDDNVPWNRLLNRYEAQQMKKSKVDEATGDPSATAGLGKLAHDIWFTEEKIRAMLLREDDRIIHVPDDLHGKLWMLASGAAVEMRRRKGQYQRYLSMELESTESTRQIDADLHRTVLDDDKHHWSEEKSKMMRRVLVAYSYFNPTLGYCQGLNYIVARLLQFVEEEEAFFLLSKMIQLVPDDYYTTMLGLAVDQHVFSDLVQLQTPDVAKHLNELGGSGMELSLACTEWFLTLFASPCNKEVTVRIWDQIFLMGDEILFRVALALMQLEKGVLLKCNTYGDMLKHLNEIGRGETDVVRLMRDSQKQEVVVRARIEDFRAHHRLQLAAGIAVSSVEAEESPDSTTDDTRDGKGEKSKVFGTKKRPGLFKNIDKNVGRLHRTFDRHLTEDYSVSLQKEHPTFSCYYDGRPPFVFEQYWGSASCSTPWGKQNYRRITEVAAPSEPKEERRRLQSDGVGLTKSLRIAGDHARGPALSRERRSKSSAFVQAKPTSHSLHHQLQHGKKPSEEDQQYSRSPKNWLQRIEVWHKDLKSQKEKKKAEKMKQKRGKGDTDGRNTGHRGLPRDRSQNHTFSAPQWRHIDDPDLARGASFDGHPGLSKSRVEKRSESMDVHVSRSYSDPFLSPNDVYARTSWHDASKQTVDEDLHGQIIMRSQDPDRSEFAKASSPKDKRRSGSHKKESRERRERRESAARRTSDTRSLRLSNAHSFSTPTLAAFDTEEVDSRLSFDMGKPPAPVVSDLSDHTRRRSSIKSIRTVSADIEDDNDTDEFFGALDQPRMRRNLSLPLTDTSLQQSARSRKITAEGARVIRERAQVLSYLQRKASDASSLAGSFPRTPRGRADTGRLSESSSDSSRYSEFLLPTNRSTKSSGQGAVRKSSFSFFDKLSLDMETHLDDLHGSFIEDDEPRESLDMDTTVFGTWSPASTHRKAFGETAATALSPTTYSGR